MSNSFIKFICFVVLGAGCLQAAGALPDPLSGFNYSSQNTEAIALSKGITAVIFMSQACPCSNSHIDHLKSLPKEFPKVQFVAVHSNQNEMTEEAARYFRSLQLPFSILKDMQAKIADRLGAVKTPQVFVVDKSGKTIYSGPVSDSRDFSKSKRHYLKEYLTSLKSGSDFKPVQKRPIGCYIVRRSN